jgi:hypothetical protein
VVWIINSELQGGSPCLRWLRPHVSWALMNKHLIMYWCIQDLWGPANLVASCVTELDDTIPPYRCYTGWCWATHGVSAEADTWKTALGWDRTRPDSLTASWTIGTRGALLARRCRVVGFYPLQGVLLIWISVTPSEMGDGLIVVFKRSNYTFIMLYLCHDMDVNYLVVKDMINRSKLFDYNCMFSTCAILWC